MGAVAKKTAIPQAVKRAVAERDSFDGHPCCLWCGSPRGQPNAHFIPRGKLGMGIEENILTLCWDCHMRFDYHDDGKMKQYFKEYLQSKYPAWDESKLVYRK